MEELRVEQLEHPLLATIVSEVTLLGVDNSGRLLIRSSKRHCVTALNFEDRSHEIVIGTETVAGTAESQFGLQFPRQVLFSRLNPEVCYVADSDGGCVKSYDGNPAKQMTTIAGCTGTHTLTEAAESSLEEIGTGRSATSISLAGIRSISLNSDETCLLVAIPDNRKLYSISMITGKVLEIWNLHSLHRFGCIPYWASFEPYDDSHIWISTDSALFMMNNEGHGHNPVEVVCGNQDGRWGYYDGPRLKALFNWIVKSIIIPLESDTIVYMCEYYNHRVRKFSKATELVSTIVGLGESKLHYGPISSAGLSFPSSIVIFNGDLLIANSSDFYGISAVKGFVQAQGIESYFSGLESDTAWRHWESGLLSSCRIWV